MSKKYEIVDEMQRVVGALEAIDPTSEEYGVAAKNLETLSKARGVKNPPIVSVDTVVVAVTNILGILLILNFEKLDVLSSKATNFIMKPRG